MKCYNHPKEDAVAVCKACGKAVCRDCLISIRGDSYCKTCVEAGRAQMPPVGAPSPVMIAKPAGIPSKTTFVVGSVGLIIAGVAAVMSIFGGLGLFWAGGYYGYGLLGMTSSILLAVGVLLAGFGYKGIKTNYGLGIGTAGFAFGIIVSVFLIVQSVFTVIIPHGYYGYYDYNSSWWVVALIFTIIAVEMFAVAQILWGVAHIRSRDYTGNSALGIAAGILLIISGAFTASIILSFVGYVLFLVGGILAMIVFLMSNIPTPRP